MNQYSNYQNPANQQGQSQGQYNFSEPNPPNDVHYGNLPPSVSKAPLPPNPSPGSYKMKLQSSSASRFAPYEAPSSNFSNDTSRSNPQSFYSEPSYSSNSFSTGPSDYSHTYPSSSSAAAVSSNPPAQVTPSNAYVPPSTISQPYSQIPPNNTPPPPSYQYTPGQGRGVQPGPPTGQYSDYPPPAQPQPPLPHSRPYPPLGLERAPSGPYSRNPHPPPDGRRGGPGAPFVGFQENLIARTVYVSNLSAGVREAHLRGLFSYAGCVCKVKLCGDSTRRFAFVEFTHPAEAQSACRLTHLIFGDAEIFVSPAKVPISDESDYCDLHQYGNEELVDLLRSVQIRGAAASVTLKDIEMFFAEKCGPLEKSVTVQHKKRSPTFFLIFKNLTDAAYSCSFSGHVLDGKPIYVQPCRHIVTRVKNASPEAQATKSSFEVSE